MVGVTTIGVDAHKRSHTAVAVDAVGLVVGEITVGSDRVGISQLLEWGNQFASRRWAVEDCRHVTVHLETALVDASEVAVRVPPHLTGPSRRSQRTAGKSDAIDAEAVARVCLSNGGVLPQVTVLGRCLEELDALVSYRTQAVHARTELINRLRWQLHRFDATWSPPNLISLKQLDAVLKRLDTIDGVTALMAERVTKRIRDLSVDINEITRMTTTRITQHAPHLVAIEGCGPIGAAVIVTRIGDIARFRSEAAFGRYCGVAPIPASSGATSGRQRLHRGGDRQLNTTLQMISLTQARCHPPAQAFIAKKRREGKTLNEARRAHKRHIARRIYNTLIDNPLNTNLT